MQNGRLIIRVFIDNVASPINGANVRIQGNNTDVSLTTDISGTTPVIDLEAPSIEYSLTPQDSVRPYSTYNVTVTKDGLGTASVIGVQVYDGVTAIQDVFFNTTSDMSGRLVTVIDPPTIWKNDTPKIIDNGTNIPSTGKVLPRIVIPGYIIVHDGIPSDTNAPNYDVNFSDYIKNVASSEIYPTWPKEALKANIHAIVSFTLNRVYTEWYLSKGYNFTITSSTAYDQKYTHNRTIYDTISDVVDEYFTNYLQFPNQAYPFFAQYSDGINVVRDGWLSQWGTKDLATKGYNALQIVRYYYGNSIDLKEGEVIPYLPTSYPGYNLKVGSCGEEVQLLQNALNKIRGSYPAIPLISNANGRFETDTKNAVLKFQDIFNLPETGIVDFATWYKISYIYVAVSDMLKGIFG